MATIQFLGSTVGRWVRIIAGVILVVLAVILGGWWLLLLATLGLVFIAAGTFDFCLLAPLAGKPLQGSEFRKTFAF